MRKPVSVAEAQNNFPDLLNRVIYRRERIIVSKHGKPVGALITRKIWNNWTSWKITKRSRAAKESKSEPRNIRRTRNLGDSMKRNGA